MGGWKCKLGDSERGFKELVHGEEAGLQNKEGR